MRIKLLLSTLIIVAMLSCSKSENSSKIGDPTEYLAWLKAIKQDRATYCGCIPTIWQVNYEGTVVYQVGCAGPACFCAHVYYDASGNIVPGSEDANRAVFLPKLSERKMLWSCK